MKEKKQKKALATPDQSDQINEAFLAIEAAIEILRDTGLSTRELSLTVTNAEQASMWLQYAANELEVELSTDEDDDEGEEDEGEDEEDGGDEGDDK
jgi:hypothetical protein